MHKKTFVGDKAIDVSSTVNKFMIEKLDIILKH